MIDEVLSEEDQPTAMKKGYRKWEAEGTGPVDHDKIDFVVNEEGGAGSSSTQSIGTALPITISKSAYKPSRQSLTKPQPTKSAKPPPKKPKDQPANRGSNLAPAPKEEAVVIESNRSFPFTNCKSVYTCPKWVKSLLTENTQGSNTSELKDIKDQIKICNSQISNDSSSINYPRLETDLLDDIDLEPIGDYDF